VDELIARSEFRPGLFVLVLIAALATPALADEAREAELERKIGVLAEEIQNMKLGQVADTARLVARHGLGPAAAKVYGAPRGVSIGGYGEMLYENFDEKREDGSPASARDQIDFLRAVLYVGYKFSDDMIFNSEIEIEHSGVQDEADVQVDLSGAGSAELTGEVVLEFAYVEWTFQPRIGARAGLLLVPLGLVNEMHEPVVTVAARRPDVERNIIPATWRANGAGIFGEMWDAWQYRAYVLEGLDATGFSAATGIRGGRAGGSNGPATHPAFAARVDYTGTPGLLAGVSAYTGESWHEPGEPALKARVTLGDLHARLDWRGLQTRVLYALGTLDDAAAISDLRGPG
jgi:hypothetical protein